MGLNSFQCFSLPLFFFLTYLFLFFCFFIAFILPIPYLIIFYIPIYYFILVPFFSFLNSSIFYNLLLSTMESIIHCQSDNFAQFNALTLPNSCKSSRISPTPSFILVFLLFLQVYHSFSTKSILLGLLLAHSLGNIFVDTYEEDHLTIQRIFLFVIDLFLIFHTFMGALIA